MMVRFTKGPAGALIPLDDGEAEKLKRIKAGAVVNADIAQMRNGPLFRRWWVLVNYAFDIWQETLPPMEYRGQKVQPVLDRFRKDLVIMAGYYTPVFNGRGELRVEAKSIAWANMSDDEFHELYQKTIDAVLANILTGTEMSEAELRAHVDNVIAFS